MALSFATMRFFAVNPPDGEGLGLVALPTEVGEAQEVESLRFPFPTPLPLTGRIAPELDQPCLVRIVVPS